MLYVVCYKGKPLCSPLTKLEATEKMTTLSRSFSNLEIVEVKTQLAAK